MKDVSTKFPNAIDDRVFFQDIQISHVPIMKQYYELLKNGNYTIASELLNNSEVFYYGAWCLNLLENRLIAIGNYVINDLENINLVNYSVSEPTKKSNGMTWIE